MSDFTDGCAEKHFYSELLVVLEGYRMNFILGFLWCVVKNLIKMESTFCCWYFTVYVSFHLDRRKNSAFVSSQVLFLDFHVLLQSLAVNMA